MRYKQIIMEASHKYVQMFDGILNVLSDLKGEQFKTEKLNSIIAAINSFEPVLKREDRIIWYLRWYRLRLARNALSWGEDDDTPLKKVVLSYAKACGLQTQNISEISEAVEHKTDFAFLKHMLSMPIPAIQNFVFQRQSPQEVFNYFTEAEEEWVDPAKQIVAHDDADEIFLKIDDTWAWYHLDREYCEIEADAMGHCGNGSGNDGDTILSLRQKVEGGTRPSLTFILDQNDMLGEMKGRKNQKPSSKYHAMIVKLLMDNRIHGIKGGGYKPENNFSIFDLPDNIRDECIKNKPNLITVDEIIKRYSDYKEEAAHIFHSKVLFSGFTIEDETVIVQKVPLGKWRGRYTTKLLQFWNEHELPDHKLKVQLFLDFIPFDNNYVLDYLVDNIVGREVITSCPLVDALRWIEEDYYGSNTVENVESLLDIDDDYYRNDRHEHGRIVELAKNRFKPKETLFYYLLDVFIPEANPDEDLADMESFAVEQIKKEIEKNA